MPHSDDFNRSVPKPAGLPQEGINEDWQATSEPHLIPGRPKWPPYNFLSSRRGLRTSSPPQFGQALSISFEQFSQKVHSYEQM